MRLSPTRIPGVTVVQAEPHPDERGSFARVFCREEFAAAGLCADVAQCNLSRTLRRATLRGLHFQAAPHAEAKLVTVVRGRIYDVALDLRRGSPTRLDWVAVELSEDDGRSLYLPEGVAHGLFTLADDTLVHYQMSRPYTAEAARGVRWDDAAFGIEWPGEPAVISARDRGWPDWDPGASP